MKKISTLLLCAMSCFAWQGFAQKPAITSIEIAGRGVASQTSFNDSSPLTSIGGGIFVWEGNLNYLNPNASTGNQGFKFIVNAHLATGVDTDWNGKWTLLAPSTDLAVQEGPTYTMVYAQNTPDNKWRLKQGEDGFYRIMINASDINNITFSLDKNPPLSVFSAALGLPTAQGWNELRLDNTINDLAAPTTLAAENGVLKINSTNAPDQFSQLAWSKTGLNFNLSTGFVLEIKAKVISADKTGAFNIQGFDKSGKGFRIGILNNAVTELTNPFNATKVLASDLTNGDAFHVYRFNVTPAGIAAVYRDGSLLGTFPLVTFQYDNIIENGGFEDAEFPDFRSNGILRRVHKSEGGNKVLIGDYALEMDNNGLVTNGWTNPESARTREIAVKPNTQYEIYITRRRTANEPWCWRDMGAFYDFQKGTLGLKGENVDERGQNFTWGGFDRIWQTHPQDFTTPANAKTVRFEFPTWLRDNTKNLNTTSFENFTFREKPTLAVIPASSTPAIGFTLAPSFPQGYVNLIQNGDFEDIAINNDGTPYDWALASSGGDTDNTPTSFNAMWNGNVRIQDKNKPDDFNSGDEFYAHSGTKCLRFSTLNSDGQGKSRNFDFTVELQPNKTYRFSFWHRNPKWDDFGWLLVRIGEGNPIWGHRTGSRANKWIPVDLVFKTTADNHTLHLYTLSDAHGDWWNQYLDDMVLYEVSDNSEGTPSDPLLEGKTNLIANGDFEDATMNNDGSSYNWALASQNSSNDNDFPMAYNEMWGTWLRIQDKEKRGTDYWGDRDDTGYDWAHSGKHSVRFTYEDNWNGAQAFEGVSGDVQPGPFKLNMNFKKELEPNKTYTFVFWIKTSCWNDKGWFHIANGDIKVMSQQLDNHYMNWSRQSVTFSTTSDNHTLRMFTEFSGWMNFYLDDLFLYEEDTYVPVQLNGNTYLAFGKSTGTSSTDAEVEYITIDNSGSHIYTAQFYSNGGSAVPAQVLADNGEALVTEPVAPAKEGYAFGGWYSNIALTNVYDFSAPVTKDLVLYAKWNQLYKVVFNSNGGETIADSTYTVESENVVLPIPEKVGYTFLGWYDNSEFTGTPIAEIPQGSTGNKEFWAKWEIAVYDVIFNLNGGSGATNTTYTIESETITLPTNLQKTGYTFVGWFDNSEFAGIAIAEISQGSSGKKEFWAKWEAVAYSITYELNGGTGVTNGSYTIESENIVLPTPEKSGYEFLGWYENSRFGGDPVTEIPSGSTGDKTFYAKWKVIDGVNSPNVSDLLLYPNPVVNDKLTIENIQSMSGQIEIYNVLGTLVSVHNITGNTTIINVSTLPTGMYFVKADGKKAIMLKK